MSIPNVMISYNRNASFSLAQTLNEKLKYIGIKTWTDMDSIGNNLLFSSITKAIDISDVIIVILSNEYCLSKHNIQEFEYALSKNKYIIPIKDSSLCISTCPVSLLESSSSLEYVQIDFSKSDIDTEFPLILKKIIRYENFSEYDYGKCINC